MGEPGEDGDGSHDLFQFRASTGYSASAYLSRGLAGGGTSGGATASRMIYLSKNGSGLDGGGFRPGVFSGGPFGSSGLVRKLSLSGRTS